jgi:hypothetical protein
MSSLTIHTIDSVLDARLSEEAKRRKISKNSLVKELLASSLGLRVEGLSRNDYREFCGCWGPEEKIAFDSAQASNSRVDAGDWA